MLAENLWEIHLLYKDILYSRMFLSSKGLFSLHTSSLVNAKHFARKIL